MSDKVRLDKLKMLTESQREEERGNYEEKGTSCAEKVPQVSQIY